jgi:hypothetical protein
MLNDHMPQRTNDAKVRQQSYGYLPFRVPAAARHGSHANRDTKLNIAAGVES